MSGREWCADLALARSVVYVGRLRNRSIARARREADFLFTTEVPCSGVVVMSTSRAGLGSVVPYGAAGGRRRGEILIRYVEQTYQAARRSSTG